MTRGAVLVSGDGGQLQAIIDSIYFNELPDFELVAVISTSREAYAMKRAASANVPAFVVDPELFPTGTSHSIAVATKLKDMDIDLVILADYSMPLGVISYQFKGQIIGSMPALYPAFENFEGDIIAETVRRGLKISGATTYLLDPDGYVGDIIYQKALDILPSDTEETLRRRIMEDCIWKILPDSVRLYCTEHSKKEEPAPAPPKNYPGSNKGNGRRNR